jgi:hypothetical protein
MRTMTALAGLAALAGALAAEPAWPAAPEEPWASVGNWQVWPFIPGACDARRHYPVARRITLRMYANREGQLIVINRLSPAGLDYRLTLVQGGRRRPLAVPRPVQSLFHGVWAEIPADAMATLAAGATLEIAGPDGRLIERTDLADLAPAFGRLGACLTANPGGK